jgi:hypothetical protein
VDVELARQEWEAGRRRIEALRASDPDRYRRMIAQVELVADELRKRVGQKFTLVELADAFDGADDWARDLLFDAADEGAEPPDSATIAEAAFHRYAHRASDYVP